MMRRVGRWLVIITVIIALMERADALRATSLIFGKTPAPPASNLSETEDETTILPSDNNTSTKPPLTGIPQIDYIYDPNLPRELNGYNLSEYPFYSSVPPPEEIDFKCDGLHDGFYASVKHKCQLYHHCLYGTRYDFLCANFTAFDQKTFICHFVSEVDCKNSPKHFNRNDALYQAATSSTTSTTTTTTTTTTPPPITPASSRPRPVRPNRRPLRRRRPQVEYYYYDEDYVDDYYEERLNRRRKNRPSVRRPEYEDDYINDRTYMDDQRYEKRGSGRDRLRLDNDDYDYDRRPYNRPRNRNRPTIVDRYESRKNDRKRPLDERKPNDDKRISSVETKFIKDERRGLKTERPYSIRNKTPITGDVEENHRPSYKRKIINNDRQPYYPDYIDRSTMRSDTRKQLSQEKKAIEKVETPLLVRPAGVSAGSVYDRPRAPPPIARPVPLNEKKKYEYTTKATTTVAPIEEEYYDEYEEQEEIQKDSNLEIVPKALVDKNVKKEEITEETLKPIPSVELDSRARYEIIRSPLKSDIPIKTEQSDLPSRNINKKNQRHEESFEFIEQDQLEEKPSKESSQPNFRGTINSKLNIDNTGERRKYPVRNRVSSNFKPTTKIFHDYLEEEEPVQDVRPVVRVVKRPFLPSRGGSPHLPRGLKPVGLASKHPTTTITSSTTTTTEIPDFNMGSTVSGVRILEHAAPIVRSKDIDDYPEFHIGPRTTQPPQIEPPKSVLDDIYENDYDVTLNDALNPTLKPIASRRGIIPRGFAQKTKKFVTDSEDYSLARDSLYSSSDLRRSATGIPINKRSHYGLSTRSSIFYDDYEY